MITPYPGWSWSRLGGSVTLRSTEGAWIRYTERKRPLRAVADLIKEALANRGGELLAVDTLEPLTTDEGEHAVLVTARVAEKGRAVHRASGFVLLDDSYAHLDGWAPTAEAAARLVPAVRRLLLADAHLLGVRRRPFRFRAPTGWNAIDVGPLHSLLCPRGPDEGGAEMHVFPALPRVYASVTEAVTALSQGLEEVYVQDERGVVAGGLSGMRRELLFRRHGQARVRDLVVLEDERYAYVMYLECARDAHPLRREELGELLGSVERIPRPRAWAGREAAEAMGAWAA